MADAMAEHLTSQGCDFRELTPPIEERWWIEWGFADDEWTDAIDAAVLTRSLWADEPPEPEAVSALAMLAERGHEVLILADSLPHRHRAPVWRWLTAHVLTRVPIAGLLCAPLAAGVDADVALVTSPPDFAAIDAEGEVVPVWLSRPWNEGVAGLRAIGWTDVPEVVEALTHALRSNEGGASCSHCGEWFSPEEIATRLLRVCSGVPAVAVAE